MKEKKRKVEDEGGGGDNYRRRRYGNKRKMSSLGGHPSAARCTRTGVYIMNQVDWYGFNCKVNVLPPRELAFPNGKYNYLHGEGGKKGITSRDFSSHLFSNKQLLLVPLDEPRQDLKFYRIFMGAYSK
jgi:hypothetical protein